MSNRSTAFPLNATLGALALTALAAASPAAAQSVSVRDAALIETIEIEGVSLAMTPREALEHLLANGYSAGEITSFDDWDGYNVSLVRGAWDTPEGESWVSLDRRGDLLVNISETFNRTRGDRFDPHAEFDALHNHFGIAADAPSCRVNDFNTGSCEVIDNAERADTDLSFVMTAQVTMLQRAATRNKHLRFD